MICKDYVVTKVLTDNGWVLNVLPKHVMDQMPIDASHMKPNTMTARAYDETPKHITGSIEIDLVIKP